MNIVKDNSKKSLYKIQLKSCSDTWVDIYSTSNLRCFEDVYNHLNTLTTGNRMTDEIKHCIILTNGTEILSCLIR